MKVSLSLSIFSIDDMVLSEAYFSLLTTFHELSHVDVRKWKLSASVFSKYENRLHQKRITPSSEEYKWEKAKH